MKVLVAFEHTGVVRDAFRAIGHSAVSLDILPDINGSLYHIEKDIYQLTYPQDYDLLIAHPPCTYLCSSGLHWNKRVEGRQEKTEESLAMVRWLMELPIPRIAIENPVGCIGTRIRPADQYIQPHQFGHDASKRTGLWLKGLPHLKATKCVPPRMVTGKRRWSNQTDSGQNRLGPSPDRWAARSATYQGIANAMANQWSK